MPVIRKYGVSAALGRMLAEAAGWEAQMGWFANSKYPDGTPVAEAAILNEFGDKRRHVPPRLGMRALSFEKQKEWLKAYRHVAANNFTKTNGAQNMMKAMALVMAGDMKENISNVFSPPLSPVTIRARLERKTPKARKAAEKRASKQRQRGEPVTIEKPLIDTRTMFNSCVGVAVKS